VARFIQLRVAGIIHAAFLIFTIKQKLMPHPIPTKWTDEPPRIIVAGDGPFATKLALSLNATELTLAKLEGGPEPKSDGAFDRRLNNLESVLFVVPDGMSAAEAMWHHHWLWDWVEKLTAGKDCHEICFIFILPADISGEFDHAIAASLAVTAINPVLSGHAIWRRSGKLEELIELSGRKTGKDLQALRGRRAADVRRNCIALFVATIKSDETGVSWSKSASRVADAFKNREYDLDLFCLPPCHRNGNLVREWLRSIVTGHLTPEIKNECRLLLPTILN
jgi:hypothetical protein